MLRKIFASEWDEVRADWKRVHNEQLRELYSLPNIILLVKSRMRWVGHVACVGDKRGVYKDRWGDLKENIQSGRPRCCWVDNIQTVFQEEG